jgi:hypothetical protein
LTGSQVTRIPSLRHALSGKSAVRKERRAVRKIGIMLVVLGVTIALGLAAPVLAQTQRCTQVDRSTKEVLPGVTLTWGSSFLCAGAPDMGTYSFTVRVRNHADSVEAVKIKRLKLSHTTPRPRGEGPDASATASGLPIVVRPGETKRFSVSGSYELVRTDEGKKANIHLLAKGQGLSSGKSFKLGINAHFRAPGVRAQ